MRAFRPFISCVALLSLAGSASAKNVFVNDVKVDGLSNQTFRNVDVVFDENGDVRIIARGYKISTVESDPKPEKPAAPSTSTPSSTPSTAQPTPGATQGGHRFYIATMQPPGRTGTAQWDIDVYINQTFVRKFRSKDPEPVFEISRFLKPGPNVVHFTAKKEEGERLSTSPNDFFELVIGDGEMRAGQVMMNRITSYKRTAAEVGGFNSETTLNVASVAAPASAQ
jgi:hypothetical protein